MTNLQDIIPQLKAYTIAYISKKAGLGHNTVQRIRSGNIKNPNYETLQKLEQFLEDERKEQT